MVGAPVHPVQIYEMVFLVPVLVALVLLRHRLKPDGSLFLLYLVLYAAWRIGIGFLRDNPVTMLGLQQAQVIAILVLVVTLPILLWRMRRDRKSRPESLEA
jgi:phosphatidylglycerol:prolipoprotein diacylglycerol transferase